MIGTNLENLLIEKGMIEKYLSYKNEDEINIKFDSVFNTYNPKEEEEDMVINVLKTFGIETLKDLDEMITKHKDVKYEVATFKGALIHYMLLEDAEKFIDRCWKKDWARVYTLDEFLKKYDIDMESLLIKYNKL